MKQSGIEGVTRPVLAVSGNEISGADALGGHTRSHPEHDG